MQVWTAAGQLLHTLKGSIVTWSPDGARLATLTARGTGRIWDTATGQELVTFHATVQNPNSLAWSTDGRSIAISATGVELIDAVTGQNLQALDTDHVLSQVRWSPDGSMFVVPFSVGRYSTSALIAHDTSTATPLLDLTSGVMWTPIAFAWSPNSQWLAIGNSGRSDGLYSIDKTKHLLNKAVDLQGAQVVWSPTGNSLAVSRNGRIDLWDPVSRRLQRSLLLGTDIADDIVWAGDRLVSVNTSSVYLTRRWHPTDGRTVSA